MRITANNVERQVCPSCGKRMCDPTATVGRIMYRAAGLEGNSISYYTATVEVPSCKVCRQKNNMAYIYAAVVFILMLVPLVVSLVAGGLTVLKFGLTVLMAAGVAVVGVVSCIGGLGVTYNLNSDDAYKPVAIMKEYGWGTEKPEKKEDFTSPFSPDDFNEMLNKIVTQCDCSVEK